MAISVNLTTADQIAKTLIVTKVSPAKLTSAANHQMGGLIAMTQSNLNAAKPSTVVGIRKFGFTLMELLVVMAIIVLLMGVTFSVYLRAREKARQTACASNLKQLGTALFLYAQDNDGYFPPYRNHPIKWPNNGPQEVKGCYISTDGTNTEIIFAPRLLFSAVNPYLKEKQVWFCPSDPFAGTPTFYWCVFHQYSSYFFKFKNLRYLRDTGYYPRDPDLARFPYTLISDPNTRKKSPCDPSLLLPDYADCVRWNEVRGGNHLGGFNNFYLDGRIKWEPLFDE